MKYRISIISHDRALVLPDGVLPLVEGQVLVVAVVADAERAIEVMAALEAKRKDER